MNKLIILFIVILLNTISVKSQDTTHINLSSISHTCIVFSEDYDSYSEKLDTYRRFTPCEKEIIKTEDILKYAVKENENISFTPSRKLKFWLREYYGIYTEKGEKGVLVALYYKKSLRKFSENTSYYKKQIVCSSHGKYSSKHCIYVLVNLEKQTVEYW